MLGAARSGWRRGVVFFLVDLVGFAVAVLLAVRFHAAPAVFFGVLGISDRWSSFLGGLAIFVPLIVITAMVGSRMSHAMYKPGLFMLDKVLGAAIAGVLAVTLATVGLLFLRAAPIPFGIGDLVKRSTIAPRVISAAEPAIAFADDKLGLDLCGGKLERIIPEVCRHR